MTTSLPLLESDGVACCSPVTAGVLDVEAARGLARMFKALGDPTRVRLLSMIAARPGREACVCDLTDPVGLSQPTVSHHMKQLADVGLVTREQRGKWAYYTIVAETLAMLAGVLDPLPADDPDRKALVNGGPLVDLIETPSRTGLDMLDQRESALL